MNIETQKSGDTLVVCLKEKRLDSSISQDFESTIKKWIADNETRILLDFENVNFVDSAGMGSIVSCLKNLKTNGSEGYLVLAGINEHVRSLFELTRMDRVFRIYQNKAQALHKICKVKK